MPVATPQQYAAMLDAAQQGNYAYPAINVTSLVTINAALKAFADQKSDGIIQISTGGGKFASGLGIGDPSQIELVGDVDAARESWNFDGPFKQMTFASRNQHRIYWGPLKKPLEWSLKTWLAPWAYVA